MKFFARNEFSQGCSTITQTGLATLLALQVCSALAADVPPGFTRLANGDIVVADPGKAFAPIGYRISENGFLVRDLDDPVAATLRDFESVESRSAAPTRNSPSAEITTAPIVKTPVDIADASEEAPPPGFHRMPNGTLMANQRDTAVAPPGYHLMPDGTLMRAGSVETADHSAHSSGSGMWMLNYKFEHMYMNGLLDTTKRVSSAEVLSPAYGFSMSPTDMNMDMHMLMLMFHRDQYMAMIMGHFMSNEMGMLASDGTKSTMSTSGWADTLVSVDFRGPYKLWFRVGVSLPTGSIDERGPMTHSAAFTEQDAKYPYSMQLGSGTTDLIQGIRYEDTSDFLAWGAGYEYKGRFQKNSNNYKLGDELRIDTWTRWTFKESFSATGKLRWTSIGQIEGVDKELNAAMSPDMDAAASGGRRLDLGVALKYETPGMTSVTLEFAAPIYQNLWGPQMKTEWIAGLGVGLMF